MIKRIKFWSKTKVELVKVEPTETEPIEPGQVTIIINEIIYDNLLIHEKIKDWMYLGPIITPKTPGSPGHPAAAS